MSKAKKTKEYIIEKTASIFNTKGYAGTSINDLTEVTGLTKGSIYGNFKNKDDVAVEAFKYNLQVMNQLFTSEKAKEKSYRGKLLIYTKILSDSSGSKLPIGGCPILNTAVESDDTHPVLKELAKRALLNWKNDFVGILNAGIQAGEFTSDLNTEQIAITILALIEGAIMINKLTDNNNHICLIMQSLRDYINQI
jgi:TetR/AcrR family transcriptional repressor of nem operon